MVPPFNAKKENIMAKPKTTEGEAPAAEKPAAPAKRLWVGPNGVREGTTYNELQKIILANPGLTEDELKTLIPQTWKSPNSAKFEKNPGVFLQGYFTAGVRKGHFVVDESAAVDTVPVISVSAATGNKSAKLTRAGRDLLDTIVSADEHTDSDGYVARTKIDELLGRPMAQLGKGVQKLLADGLIEQGSAGEGDDAIATVRITDAGRTMLKEADAAAAASTQGADTAEAPAAEVAEAEEA